MAVIFDHINSWGVITINKPATLNALDLEMVMAIRGFLRNAADVESIKGIMIQSLVPNIFCAGGDIKAVYQWCLNNDTALLSKYVEEEYGLNADIRAFPKPVVAIMNGLTLGGGVGLSRYATYRIATTDALIGMPEVKIAFFPDVGAGYFLNLLDQPLARFLALTGYLLREKDLVTAGYATHLVSPESLAEMTKGILKTESSKVGSVLPQLKPDSSQLDLLTDVVSCFKESTLERCLFALSKCDHTVASTLYQEIQTFSPYALKVIWCYMGRTRGLPYEDVLKIDIALAKHMFHHSDMFEGIRTRLIDKGDQPKWKYPPLDAVKMKVLSF